MRTQRGIALVTAVLIVAIAAAVAVQIAFAQQIWFRQMENVSDRDATDWLRRGALHWASVALIDDATQGSIDHLGESWAMGLPTLPVEGGTIRASIEDAQGRFNLNNLWRNNAESKADVDILRHLLGALQLDQSLADTLLDWIDPDNLVRTGGAEDTDYLNGNPPYRAANQLLVSVEELRLVRGFDAKAVAALSPYVTVLPAASDINVNTASPVVLAALVPGLDVQTAERIAEARLGNPFRDVGAFTQRLPQGIAPPQGGMSVKTDYFLVTLDTSIGRHERRSEALLQRLPGGTNVVWHRPRPLTASPVGVPASPSTGSDETDDSK